MYAPGKGDDAELNPFIKAFRFYYHLSSINKADIAKLLDKLGVGTL